jgi:uncharacterized protein (DUF2062 family)
MNLKRSLRYSWLKFRRLNDSPQKLAWGMALGVFIGVTPTIPLHTIMGLALAPLLRVSPVTTFLGMVWVSNPLTIAPLYYLAYEVGSRLLFRGDHLVLPQTLDLHAILDLVWRGGLALQLGGLILALPSALLAYILTLWAVRRFRRARSPKVHFVFPDSSNNPAAPGSEA